MMQRIIFLTIMLFALPLQATPVIADMSDYDIRIDSSFTGTSLLLFGARNEPGEVVVVVRGPQKKFMIQKKERIMGMWMNTKRAVFPQLPGFLAVASSKPLDHKKNQPLFGPLQIGFDEMRFDTNREIGDETKQAFKEAILEYQQKRKLFSAKVDNTTFMGETLFKTRINFPDNIPRGIYTAEIYLIANGTLVGMQSIPITVTKVGFDSLIYDFAHQSPGLYGILCVMLAFSIGWSASLIFRRS